MNPKNDFSASAKYYDLILGKEEFRKNAAFVDKILKKHKVHTVLELGCGSGLYLFPLKKAGYAIEGLDISKEMLQIARKQDSTIKLHKKDMSNFELKKSFDTILCLNSSLVLLPTMRQIQKTIKLCEKHLTQEGLLLLDLPNHKVEIKEEDKIGTRKRYKKGNEVVEVIFQDYKKGNKWVSHWQGFVKTTKKKKEFTEHYEELIYEPKKLEEFLKKEGFTILNLFGTRKGGKFYPNKSYRRFYVCKLVTPIFK